MHEEAFEESTSSEVPAEEEEALLTVRAACGMHIL